MWHTPTLSQLSLTIQHSYHDQLCYSITDIFPPNSSYKSFWLLLKVLFCRYYFTLHFYRFNFNVLEDILCLSSSMTVLKPLAFILYFFLKISFTRVQLITNRHNQKLINILENQKIYGGFLKILIFRVSLSRTHLLCTLLSQNLTR